MVNIFRCSKCGHFASSDSPVCRHCNDDPRPSHIICRFCEKPAPIDGAVNKMHRSCWAALNAHKDLHVFSCSGCGTILEYADLEESYSLIICSQCGQRLALERCAFCDQSLSRGASVQLWTVKGKHQERPSFYHETCSRVIVEHRGNTGLCETCGRKLENIQSFTNFALGKKVCLFCESRKEPARLPGMLALQPAKD